MQVTYCDYCHERITNPNDLVTLEYNHCATAKFPISKNHLHTKCASRLKSYTDGFLKTEVKSNA